jgi:uncharacterized protein
LSIEINMSCVKADGKSALEAGERWAWVRRTTLEDQHSKRRSTNGPRDSLLLRHRITALALRTALQLTGSYSNGIRNALSPVVRHLQFEFADLPTAFEGFRILHLADLHIDGLDGLAENIAKLVAGLEVDLCVMTGDYRFRVEGPCDAVYPRIRTILAGVRARCGVVGILGNHDTLEMAVELERCGVRMLINEPMEIASGASSIWVAGVDDPHYYGCDDLAAALEGVPREEFKILLAHSPELFSEAAAAEINLYLCGHTHGGQIRLPWIGAPLLNAACPRAYTHGLWQHDRMQGYTSAGLGCSMLPVRFNCAPEIAVIEMMTKLPQVMTTAEIELAITQECDEVSSSSS